MAISAVEVDFRENDQDNNYSGDIEKVTFPSKRLLYVDDAIELYKNDVAAYGQVKTTDIYINAIPVTWVARLPRMRC